MHLELRLRQRPIHFSTPPPPTPPQEARSILCHSKYLLKLGNGSNTGKVLRWICHSGGAEPIGVKIPWQLLPPSQDGGFQS